MVNDGGIHFPPGQRRDKPSFEPPPWERDQFDELVKRKQEAEAEVKAEELPAEEESLADLLAEVQATEAPKAPVETIEESEQLDAGDETEKPQLDPKHVEILMMGLRSEEPRADEAYWKIKAIAGAVSALMGFMLAVWGFVAVATPKKAGSGAVLFVAVLLVFGIGFMAAGLWVVFRSLRQQGVL